MQDVLQGRVAIISGASQGLGFAITRAYVQAGADVMMCARTQTELEKARQEVCLLSRRGQQVLTCVADVSQEKDVQSLMEKTYSRFQRVHILVNNAGIYGPMGLIEEVDWNEWVAAININFLGSVLMCRAMVPHFKKYKYGKIIQISGGGATNPMPQISAYAASKAAIIRFAETLAEELRKEQIDVNAIAPGPLNTRLLDEVIAAGPEKAGELFYQRAINQKKEGGVSIERGAALALFLASSQSDGITGKLISAIWDPWELLANYRDELRKTDIYTLRRIVPEDRGMKWGNKS
jgi:NAD(P)-dependent dehydrogenase (short-subunit alcohol dehydrogenase family)